MPGFSHQLHMGLAEHVSHPRNLYWYFFCVNTLPSTLSMLTSLLSLSFNLRKGPSSQCRAIQCLTTGSVRGKEPLPPPSRKGVPRFSQWLHHASKCLHNFNSTVTLFVYCFDVCLLCETVSFTRAKTLSVPFAVDSPAPGTGLECCTVMPEWTGVGNPVLRLSTGFLLSSWERK